MFTVIPGIVKHHTLGKPQKKVPFLVAGPLRGLNGCATKEDFVLQRSNTSVKDFKYFLL